MIAAPDRSTLYQDFEERFAGSKTLFQRAGGALAGGMAHDGRHQKPYPLYMERAAGAHKWDVDGHEFIDYAIGHGALILGHLDKDVVAALNEQLTLGTHYGSGHLGEILWSELVQKLIPSADRVRFVGSGTEANILAMRIARIFTGKNTIMKFEGHFHGWSDYLVKGERPPFETASVPGVPDEVLRTVAVIPNDDLGAVEERLTQGDVAAIIIEPSGASWATIPLAAGYLAKLRELATAYGAVLIFDEVITGFRWAPGGAQERFGITPDMTTMAKIVAGGLPGGAVAGKAEIPGRARTGRVRPSQWLRPARRSSKRCAPRGPLHPPRLRGRATGRNASRSAPHRDQTPCIGWQPQRVPHLPARPAQSEIRGDTAR